MIMLSPFFKRLALGITLTLAAFTFSGCENMSVGVGMSGYNSSTGMSYGIGTSTGPYGSRSSVSVGYSSGGYYGRPPYGRW